MGPQEGLVAIAVISDRPVLAVHYVSPDNEFQFNLNSVAAGPILFMQVKPGELNYPGHLQFA